MTDLPEQPRLPLSPSSAERGLALAQIHVATFFFGCAGLFGKLIDAGPATITAGRTFFGSMVLFAACWLTGSPLRIRAARDLAMLFAAGAVLAFHWYSFFAAIQIATVAIGLLGFASFPMFVTLLEPIFFGERLTVFDLLTAAVVVAGLLLLVPSFNLMNNATIGVCWGIASGFTFAVFSLLSRLNVGRYPQLTVTAYQQAFALVCMLPLAATLRTSITWHTLWLLVILGVIFTAAAHALFIGSLRSIRTQTASIIVALEPVYGIMLAALFLAELPALRTVLGGSLVLGSALASTVRTMKNDNLEKSATNDAL